MKAIKRRGREVKKRERKKGMDSMRRKGSRRERRKEMNDGYKEKMWKRNEGMEAMRRKMRKD